MTPRPDRFVVDASVVLKWIVEEDGSEAARALRDADMAAPALIRIELANVLRTLAARQEISASQAEDLFAFLQSAPVLIVDHDAPLERRALELALELQHPVYDCVYLALADRMDRTLVTADRRFLRGLSGTGHAGRAIALTDLPQGSR